MDTPTTAAMKDLILVLCDKLKNQDPSLEWKDLLPSDSRTITRSISSLALTPDHVLHDIYADIREQHNRFLPVTVLPLELLVKILQEVLQLDCKGGHKDTRTKLSLVCRQWRRVVIGSPALWTRWHLPNDGLDYFRRAPRLLRSLGLELSYTQPSDYSDQEMWCAVYEEVYRWQDVDFTSLREKFLRRPTWPKLGNTTTPKLRKLRLDAPNLSTPLDLFDPSDPCNLEELALERTRTVVWEGWNLQRLRDLSLYNISSGGPSEAQLLRILEQSPQLEHLSLIEVATSHKSTGLPMPNEPVCLPHLLTLQLSNVDYNSDLIVRMMRFPQCKHLVLEGFHLGIADPGSASSLAHLIPVIDNIIKVGHVTLDVKIGELRVFARAKGGIKMAARFRIRGDPPFGLNWFIDATSAALDASSDINIKLYSNFSYDGTMEIISKLGRLRGIIRLEFEGRPEDDECNPLDCLDNLGDQIRHVFPRLDILGCRIDTVSELESLRRVVLCRNGTSSSQEAIEMSGFRKVIVQRGNQRDLRGRYDEGFDEIRALIPGGNLEIRSGRDPLDEALISLLSR
ncbi:hypothetical protein FRC04_006709 [Tulasnella sp. 424]|nr:hypothetical protein FRC04_006709 [Tulasnella sp. 424]KAG8963139.1 hypothetical protein FRC05_004910 [Tulasnella sp. 425]